MTNEQEIKKAFAYEWLKEPSDAYGAALKVTSNDTFVAMQIVNKWSFDPDVIAFKKELVAEHGEEHFLPSRFQMVRELIDRGRKSLVDDSFVKIYKLAADMQGFIEKPGVTINNTMTNNKVMIVPVGRLNDNGTVDADGWEQQAITQQKTLVE